MFKAYTRRPLLGRLLLGASLLLGAAATAQAQALNYGVSGATNVAGTYTDLGTTGTVITTANNDDANSAAQPIGFSFSYNGTTFTQFVLNTNGLVRLGAAAPSATNMYGQYEGGTVPGTEPVGSTDPADVNLLMPFNFDLTNGSSPAEYRVFTDGTQPNRVCTIQWKNVSDKANVAPTQYANFSFQLKLYETSNRIEFVYGTATPSTNTPGPRFPTVGIKGSGAASGQTVLANKTTSGAAWSTTVFITGEYGTSTHNFRANIGPDPGRTYRFNPTITFPNDAAVLAVYTLGKIATPQALPQAVRAFVRNVGSNALNNLVVTMNMTGANTLTQTFTIATLAVGAQGVVNFPNLPATLNQGTNTITVSVPSDDNNANNSASYGQQVTTSRLSYIDPSAPLATALSGGAANNALVARFTVPNAVTLTDLTVTFSTLASSTDQFQAVVYDATGANSTPGRQIFISPAQARPAAGGNVVVTLPQIQIPAGSFYVGLKELGTNGAIIAAQDEVPLRAGTFLYSADAATNWIDVASTTLQRRLAFEVGIVPAGTTATQSAVLGRATTVFPNPSTGVFNLDIQGAGAPNGLAVQVTDMLGRVVYNGSARDNFRTTLDLSQLTTGIYLLTLRNGTELLTRQLSITK